MRVSAERHALKPHAEAMCWEAALRVSTESQRLEPTAAVAAVVGNNGNNGSGIDSGGDDCSCGDGKCDGSSSGDGNSHGSGKATKTTAATAMAVGGNTTINWKEDDWNSDGNGNGDVDRQHVAASTGMARHTTVSGGREVGGEGHGGRDVDVEGGNVLAPNPKKEE
jgi:hypothetical protein